MNTHTRFKAEDSGSSFISRFLDIATIALAMYFNLKLQEQVTTLNYIFLLTTVLVAYLYTAESVKLYRSLRIYSMTNTLWLVLFSLFMAFSAMLVVVFTLKITADFSRLVLGGWFVMSLSVLCLWRFLGRLLKNTLHKKGISTKRVAIVGCTSNALQLRDEIKQRPEMGLVFAGIYDDRTPERLKNCRKDLVGRIDDAVNSARDGDIDILYITLPMSADKRIAEVIQQLGDTTVDVHLVPDFLLYNLMHARFGRIGKVETISVFESPYFGARDWIKRSFDIAFSFVALMFLALPMLAIAIAIKLTSRGPVFFKQDRYGLDGKPIKVFKFRSMTVQENGAKVVQATKGDARITPLGAFLRRTSLDELPQFINVLLGDMSVVGPRPHAVAHNEEYRKLVAFYMLRHKVKPGITGWAQINGWRGETDTLEKMEKRVEFDLAYIKNWSLWLDIKIVFLTFFRGFTGKHVY